MSVWSIIVDFPFGNCRNSLEIRWLSCSHLVRLNFIKHYLGLIEATVAPEACIEVVGTFAVAVFLVAHEVLDDSCILHGGTTLLKDDLMCIWDLQKLPQIIFAISCHLSEMRRTMADFNWGEACIVPVHHLIPALLEHCLWQDAWSSTKIVYMLAHYAYVWLINRLVWI